jgi:hypothetical protein
MLSLQNHHHGPAVGGRQEGQQFGTFSALWMSGYYPEQHSGSGPDGTDTVDLILGASMKSYALTPNAIYEIRECLSELTVGELGQSAAITVQTPLNGAVEQVFYYRDRWLLTLQAWREKISHHVAD